jgi:hypothetical protein
MRNAWNKILAPQNKIKSVQAIYSWVFLYDIHFLQKFHCGIQFEDNFKSILSPYAWKLKVVVPSGGKLQNQLIERFSCKLSSMLRRRPSNICIAAYTQRHKNLHTNFSVGERMKNKSTHSLSGSPLCFSCACAARRGSNLH